MVEFDSLNVDGSCCNLVSSCLLRRWTDDVSRFCRVSNFLFRLKSTRWPLSMAITLQIHRRARNYQYINGTDACSMHFAIVVEFDSLNADRFYCNFIRSSLPRQLLNEQMNIPIHINFSIQLEHVLEILRVCRPWWNTNWTSIFQQNHFSLIKNQNGGDSFRTYVKPNQNIVPGLISLNFCVAARWSQ